MVNLNVGKCQNKKTICISTALSDISLCLYIRSWAVTMFSLSLTIIALASGTLFTTLTSATRLKLNCDNSQSLLVIVFARESFIEFRSERCMRHTFAWSKTKLLQSLNAVSFSELQLRSVHISCSIGPA